MVFRFGMSRLGCCQGVDMRFWGFCLVVGMTTIPLLGQAGDEALFPCRIMEKDLDRLACYDKASGRTPVETKIPSSIKGRMDPGPWDVRVQTSKMTDQKSVFLTTRSKSPVSCGRLRDERASLILRCLENTTSLTINTNCHLTSSSYNDYGNVDIRLDDAKTRTVPMVESTSSDTLGLWSGGRSIPMIKSMFGKATMLARLTPYSESPVLMEFDIAGTEEVIKPLRDACGW